ncbi:hypothetical protein BB560_005863, partial [Smittium megazygosporum]
TVAGSSPAEIRLFVGVSEWLRRQIRNLLGSARTGSSPVADEICLVSSMVEREAFNLKVAEFGR